MDRTYTVTVLSTLLISHSIFGLPGDPVMFYSPYEARAANTFSGPFNPLYQPVSRSISSPPERQILHKNVPNAQVVSKDHSAAQNFTINDLLESLDEVRSNKEDEHFKAVVRDYDYAPYPRHPISYNYAAKPSYGPPSPAYHEPPSYAPPVHHSPAKFSFLKPDLTSLVKPVTTKVASKVSGLLALVLTLLTGSAPGDLEANGFKDILINGILKPLLIAKGGIKSLISKLVIPVISLLLINLEVLITVWWLWEECPAPKPSYTYTKPEYNSYNSYR